MHNQRDDCGGQRPDLVFTGSRGIRLIVKAEDAERADEVLKSRMEEPS